MSTEIAVQGMLTGYRTMADGSLRLTIELDELQAGSFHEGFHGINIAVAVARLHEVKGTGEGS